MITSARQLKDLIRNLSKKKSADAQILMRNYMMERFLERISLSEYKDKFILKGGMLVAAMVGLDARATMDLDATIKGANVSLTDVETIISNIIAIPIDDGVSFCIKRISEIMEEADYPRVRVSMETKFDGVITPLKIDIYILQKLHGEQLNKEILWNALVATARKRGTLDLIESNDIREIFDEIEASPVMESLWKTYQKNYSYAADVSWHIIMEFIRNLYQTAFSDKFEVDFP